MIRTERQASIRRSLAPLVLFSCAWLLWPAQSAARALVRFIHALPGVGAGTLRISEGRMRQSFGSLGFAQVTPWRSLRAGHFHWSLVRGDQVLAHGNTTAAGRAYDMIVLAKRTGSSLGVYATRAGKPGTSLLRVINAAPELGAPELVLGTTVIASHLSFTRATPYQPVHPGVYSLSAVGANSQTPLAGVKHLKLTAGIAYSALLLGSRGERLRIVTVTDRGAPLTRPAASGKQTRGAHSGSGPETVVVDSGDSLWSIARDALGPSASNLDVYRAVQSLWALNHQRIGTGDPNLIFPGQRLVLPNWL